jgi:linoleate 10R-lipoxygenase
MLTKLLFRTLPSCYPAGSVYSHFPFIVPEYLKTRFVHLPENVMDKYLWPKPSVDQECRTVDTLSQVLQVLSNKDQYKSEYRDRLRHLTKNAHLDCTLVQIFLLVLPDDALLNDIDIVQVKQILFPCGNPPNWRLYFLRTTEELIQQKSVSLSGSRLQYVDIVNDVINLLPIYWIANEIVC